MNEDQEVTNTEDLNPPRLERFKNHLKENKTKYLVGVSGVSCLVIGTVAGWKLRPEVVIKPVAKNTMLAGYKSPQTILQETVVQVAARADRGHVVIDAATGLPVGGSLTEAAINEGISRASLLKNTRGFTETAANGKQYIDLGENLSEMVTRQVSV